MFDLEARKYLFDLAGEEKLGLFVYWLNKRLLFLLLLLLLHYIFTTTFTTTNLQSTSYGLGNRIWGSQLSRYNSKSINCYRKQQILHQLLLKTATPYYWRQEIRDYSIPLLVVIAHIQQIILLQIIALAWLLDRGFLLDISRYNLKKAKSNAQPNFLHHVSSKSVTIS